MDGKKILEKLREICLALPKTSEATTFGHRTFQVGMSRSGALIVVKRRRAVGRSPR